ncbi:MAG: CPBP family intramembrane glutamic endopeptidase [Acidobacteriota bacterium]
MDRYPDQAPVTLNSGGDVLTGTDPSPQVSQRAGPVWIWLELAAIYLLVQLYIWRWQYTHRNIVWLILAALLASHLWHRDGFRSIGIRLDTFFPCLRQAALAAIPFFVVLTVVGVFTGRLWEIPLSTLSLWPSLRYTLWGTFQQYGLQGYYHNRLMRLIRDPRVSSWIAGALFMSFHIPNPVLIVFTFAGGIVLSRLYANHRNLFVLGLFHGLVGLLLSNVFPKPMLRNMRVGPGYYR